MRVAILYICTGKYNQFFPDFYNSAEKYFLKGIADIEYFVWTDNMQLTTASNVHLIEKQCEGFPKDSLFRFDMFLGIKEKLQTFDYVFFCNANQLMVAPVGEEILPKDEGMMAVLHPMHYNRPSFLLPYDRQKKSTAYIAPGGKNYHYYMGSFNGGKAEDFIKFAEVCSRNTHIDYDNGVMARVHDESHLNKYMREHKCLALSPAYAFPNGRKMPFEPKIVLRDKTLIDPYFKKRSYGLKGKLRLAWNMFYRAIIWYL